MSTIRRTGAEDARINLPRLLEAAEKGHATVITRRGREVAAIVPAKMLKAATRQESILPLLGSGKGLWGKNSTQTIRKLRDEWSR